MDFAAWQSRFHSDPALAATTFHARRRALPESQLHAIWASLSGDPAWQAESPADAPLRGVPFAVKDLFPLAGELTRAGGKLPARRARRDSTLVARLRDLGAIPVGKTHLHEFAYGLTGENPHYGHVEHPALLGRDAGGSSSGSAAAVAAGIVPFALGTDTGGSLRVPAAFCGLYSWREVPGDAWIADAFPLAPSFDTAGWLTRSAADLRRLHIALRGPFPLSPDRNTRYARDGEKQSSVRSSAFRRQHLHGIPPEGGTPNLALFPASTEPPRGAWISPAAFALEASTALEARAATFTSEALPPDHELCRTFAGSNLAYSVLQSTEAYGVHQFTLDARRADYGDAVWQRIDRGRRWTAAQLDAARLMTLRVRLAFARFFETHDFVIMPVSTAPAPQIGDLNQQVRDTLLTFTTPVSLAGLPALTVPVALDDGLTLGLQFVFPSRHSAALNWILARCETC